MNNVVDKIRKLLNLSRSDNQAEAELALTKAKEIAVANGIDMARIAATTVEERHEKQSVKNGQRFCIAQRYTTGILQTYFNVRVIYTGDRWRGRFVNLLGKESDVAIAIYLQEFLNRTFMDTWRAKQKHFKLPVSSRDSFLLGIYTGLGEKLAKQAEEAERAKLKEIEETEGAEQSLDAANKYALVLKSDEEKLALFVGEQYPKLHKTQHRKLKLSDRFALEEGIKAGKELELRKVINGGAGILAIQ
jgi:hypothetical protein